MKGASRAALSGLCSTRLSSDAFLVAGVCKIHPPPCGSCGIWEAVSSPCLSPSSKVMRPLSIIAPSAVLQPPPPSSAPGQDGAGGLGSAEPGERNSPAAEEPRPELETSSLATSKDRPGWLPGLGGTSLHPGEDSDPPRKLYEPILFLPLARWLLPGFGQLP